MGKAVATGIKIVNIHAGQPYDVYGGRPGTLGNPFAVGADVSGGHGGRFIRTRDEAISAFESYFHKRVEKDADFRRYVLSCRGKTVGCFCFPKSCHLSVIDRWLRSNEK